MSGKPDTMPKEAAVARFKLFGYFLVGNWVT